MASGANSVPIVAGRELHRSQRAKHRRAPDDAECAGAGKRSGDPGAQLRCEWEPDPREAPEWEPGIFEWDAANRLVKVVDPDTATTTEWKYNGRGQRMEEKVNGTVAAKWRWNGAQLREMIAGTTIRRYFGNGMQWTANNAQPTATTN